MTRARDDSHFRPEFFVVVVVIGLAWFGFCLHSVCYWTDVRRFDSDAKRDTDDSGHSVRATEPVLEKTRLPEAGMERDIPDRKLHVMPDTNREIPIENEEAAANEKAAAQTLIGKGKFGEALPKLSRVLELTPTAMNFAARGDLFLKLQKPLSAIADADIALAINPDSIQAKKVRGKAVRNSHSWQAI